MRRQANGWGAGNQSRNRQDPGAQGLMDLESRNLGGVRASQRGTGGTVECATVEEDGTVIWEALAFLGEKVRGDGDPVKFLRRAVRLVGARAAGSEKHRASRPTPQGKTGVVSKQGSRMAA